MAEDFVDRYCFGAGTLIVVTRENFASVGKPFGVGAARLPQLANLAAAQGDIFGLSLEFGTDAQAARMACEDINKRYAGRLAGFQNLGSVDVVAYGCSKGTGVEVVRKALGVSVVAGAGDSYNDLPLLTAADVSYTFHTSPAQVRAAATHTVEDLAEALGHFMQSMGQ